MPKEADKPKDRQSRSGKDDRAKKGGKGGGYTWEGDGSHDPAAPDTGDPMYDGDDAGLGANYVFVGCYTQKEGHIKGDELGAGVYTFRLLPDGSLSQACDPAPCENPSFVATDAACSVLVATNEVDGFGGKQNCGAVTAFAIEQSSGALTKLNERGTDGAHPCHAQFTASGTHVVCANYSGGSVAAFPITGAAGAGLGEMSGFMQFEGSGPDAGRQGEAHAHQSVVLGNDKVLVPDLGSDKLRLLRLTPEGALEEQAGTSFVPGGAPGAGPRHIVLHPTLPTAYLIHEMGSIMTTLRRDDSTGGYQTVQTLSTLPDGYEGVHHGCETLSKNHCADVHVSPDGRFLYGSNRGMDSIVTYSIDSTDGTLTLVGHEYVGGSIPRNFGITPNGEFMLVACQDTHNINTFRINRDTGELSATGHSAHVGSPVCVCFANLSG